MDLSYKFKSSGPLLLVTGPAGGGKNSVINGLTAHFHYLIESISVTTRWPPRPGEQNWGTYHYTDDARFLWMLQSRQLAEMTRIHNNSYATLGLELETLWSRGMTVIIGVDTAGIDNFINLGLNPVSIFVDTPDEEEQKRRLLLRDPGIHPDDLATRMDMSRDERGWANEAEAAGKVVRLINHNLTDTIRDAARIFGLDWEHDHLPSV